MIDKRTIYAIGDIHGRSDLLIAARKVIKGHELHTKSDEKIIIYLGDYIDRGPDSKGVINQLKNNPMDGYFEICLKGNHEQMMYMAVEYNNKGGGGRVSGSWMDMWILNGGKETMNSYGYDGSYSPSDIINFYKSNQEMQSHCHWMKSLPSTFIDGPYAFVHAGIVPGIPFTQQDPMNFLWVRDKFTRSTAIHEYKIVHGHTPRIGIVEHLSNRINLDSGSYITGIQHILAITDGEESILETPQFKTNIDDRKKSNKKDKEK